MAILRKFCILGALLAARCSCSRQRRCSWCCRYRHSSSNALHLRPAALLHQSAAPEEEEEEKEEEEEDRGETNPTILEVLRWTLHKRRTSAVPSPTPRTGSSFCRASIGRRLISCERSVRSGRAAVWRRAA